MNEVAFTGNVSRIYGTCHTQAGERRPAWWEPSGEQWATGRTACPECGGWVITAALAEPDS